MAVVRFDTYRASMYLVYRLTHAGAHILDDGGDIILVRLPTGEQVSIHLIETPIPPYEIKSTLLYNQANDAHTLFILWADMLLPPEGHLVDLWDWEEALLPLYGNRIYAWDKYGPEVFIFPVHYDREGNYRNIRYGDNLNIHNLRAGEVKVDHGFMSGTWRTAGFVDGEGAYHTYGHRRPTAPPLHALAALYERLQLTPDADIDTIKTAYRRMARKYHPDLNRAPNSTAMMQAINEAYQKIMEQFDDIE